MSRVVVVGAGMGGLAAAARLAALGHDVVVCEAADEVGGKAGAHRRDGFVWDTGPSLVTIPQVVGELFAETGAPLEEVVALEPIDPLVRHRFADGTWMDARAGAAAQREATGAALGARAAEEHAAFLGHAGAVWDAVEQPFLRSGAPGVGGLLAQTRRVGDLATVAPWRTLRGLGRRWLTDPRLRRWLERYATYTGSDPRRAPAALAAIPYAEHAFGVWHVPGGVRRLVGAVADRAVERGAVLRTGARVRAVATRGGRVAGVELADGEAVPADVVVANVDAWHLARDLLPRAAAGPLARRLARAEPSLSGLTVLLGVRRDAALAERLAHHTVLFGGRYDDELDALFGPAPHPVVDPTVYVARPPEPTAAPEGCEAWFVLVNAPRHVPGGVAARGGGVDWDTPGLAEREADRLLEVMAARGVDVRDRVVTRAVRTPADVARATRSPGGAIYGTASNSPTAAFLRPPVRTHLPGLYCVGGSAHPGGGLPLVTLSAATAARLIGPA